MKVGIIGCGWVGSSIAISTLHSGIARTLLLNDANDKLAEGEAMDLVHGASFFPSADVRASSIESMLDADAIVIAAGRGSVGPTEDRLALLKDNAAIARSLGQQLKKARGIIVVVTNPVDVMTQLVLEASGLPPERVIGTGTMLDTARLRQVLGRELNLDPRSVHGQVLGEHGDSEVVLWSGARAGGLPLRQWPQWNADIEQRIATEVRCAASEIIARKGATNHAIGLVTAALLRWMLRAERRIVTVSRLQHGACGLHNVVLSLPTVVGADGATHVVEPNMDPAERAALQRSADVLQRALRDIQ